MIFLDTVPEDHAPGGSVKYRVLLAEPPDARVDSAAHLTPTFWHRVVQSHPEIRVVQTDAMGTMGFAMSLSGAGDTLHGKAQGFFDVPVPPDRRRPPWRVTAARVACPARPWSPYWTWRARQDSLYEARRRGR